MKWEIERGLPGWKALGFETYKDFLNSSHWLEKKAIILKVKGNKCNICNSEKNLEVHHLSYKNVGNEHSDEVEVLCHDCHILRHIKEDKEDDDETKDYT